MSLFDSEEGAPTEFSPLLYEADNFASAKTDKSVFDSSKDFLLWEFRSPFILLCSASTTQV